MSILIVGNVLKDVYLNLDSRTEHFETDKHGTKWLDLAFNASEHSFFNRSSNYGGAAISMEVLSKLDQKPTISNFSIEITDDGLSVNGPVSNYRYILITDGGVSYLTPSTHPPRRILRLPLYRPFRPSGQHCHRQNLHLPRHLL